MKWQYPFSVMQAHFTLAGGPYQGQDPIHGPLALGSAAIGEFQGQQRLVQGPRDHGIEYAGVCAQWLAFEQTKNMISESKELLRIDPAERPRAFRPMGPCLAFQVNAENSAGYYLQIGMAGTDLRIIQNHIALSMAADEGIRLKKYWPVDWGTVASLQLQVQGTGTATAVDEFFEKRLTRSHVFIKPYLCSFL
jgi:hypothetical protein